jgi:hypothetical protein
VGVDESNPVDASTKAAERSRRQVDCADEPADLR